MSKLLKIIGITLVLGAGLSLSGCMGMGHGFGRVWHGPAYGSNHYKAVTSTGVKGRVGAP